MPWWRGSTQDWRSLHRRKVTSFRSVETTGTSSYLPNFVPADIPCVLDTGTVTVLFKALANKPCKSIVWPFFVFWDYVVATFFLSVFSSSSSHFILWRWLTASSVIGCCAFVFCNQVVDMRWGVRDESTDDHSTLELCLKELKACQDLSTGPNFVVNRLNLLRYWRPSKRVPF